MRTVLQSLLWIGVAYLTYKRMYPDGLPTYQTIEPTKPNHKTDITHKNSPAQAKPKKPKKTTKTALKKSSKKQP